MKKNWILLCLLSVIIIYSCGKSGRDVYPNFDRVDDLFSRIKEDSNYWAFYDLVVISSNIMKSNSKKSGKSDTAILNNKELLLEEKYKRLNYSDYNTIESNAIQQYTLINKLISKYPEFKTLTEPESKKLVLLSNKYYQKFKK